MILRFSYEMLVGLATLIAILLFGEKGFALFALLALLPIIMRTIKVKPDERELQLFYRSGNATLALTILSIFLIYQVSGWTVNGHVIGDYWMPLSISAVLFSRGLVGLLYFKLA